MTACHAFGMAGLWTASTLNGPSSGANFDGGYGNRTGWGSGASIDQIVARAHGSGMPYERAPDDPVQETPYRTVELGVQCLSPNSLNRMIYDGESSPIHPETSPRAAFNRLFAGVTPTGEAPATDQGAEQERTERKAIVDLLKNDLTRIRRPRLQPYPALVARTHQRSPHHVPRRAGSTPGAPEIDAWYSEQIAYLLGRLDAVSEGDGTLLDNTLVVVGRELGSTAHRMERVPLVMAGGARGALKTGRYLDYDGQDHAKLLVSIAQLMGLETSSIGNRKPDSGPLSGLA
ncbi:DUF1552 domain-containing protein [Sorangium sp. So ce861]|uniref:DUF1552 domain-containing protein n=1 Tax=Sorangium sp. So ce861 TaxID=3133323 RepID=UPI003F6243AA